MKANKRRIHAARATSKKIIVMGQFSLLLLLYVFACTKDNPKLNRFGGGWQPAGFHTPVAVILGDTIVSLKCSSFSDPVSLNASFSSDADNDISSYSWQQISGPSAIHFANPNQPDTRVDSLIAGRYGVELTVTDSTGLWSIDTAWIVVSDSNFDYDLNFDFQTGYYFNDNVETCPMSCYYADQTILSGTVDITAPETIDLYMLEETDSAANAFHVINGYTSFRLSAGLVAGGPSSFDLKKLIEQGGGPFSGTIQLTGSSALGTCREAGFNALPPLTVSGSVNTTTHTVKMHVQGKIVF